MTSGSDDFLPTQNVWSFKSRRVELRTFEIPVVGGGTVAAEAMENLWYLCTVAGPDPDPDPNPRGGVQLPNP